MLGGEKAKLESKEEDQKKRGGVKRKRLEAQRRRRISGKIRETATQQIIHARSVVAEQLFPPICEVNSFLKHRPEK